MVHILGQLFFSWLGTLLCVQVAARVAVLILIQSSSHFSFRFGSKTTTTRTSLPRNHLHFLQAATQSNLKISAMLSTAPARYYVETRSSGTICLEIICHVPMAWWSEVSAVSNVAKSLARPGRPACYFTLITNDAQTIDTVVLFFRVPKLMRVNDFCGLRWLIREKTLLSNQK